MIRQLELGKKITSHLRIEIENQLLAIVLQFSDYVKNNEVLKYVKSIDYYEYI